MLFSFISAPLIFPRHSSTSILFIFTLQRLRFFLLLPLFILSLYFLFLFRFPNHSFSFSFLSFPSILHFFSSFFSSSCLLLTSFPEIQGLSKLSSHPFVKLIFENSGVEKYLPSTTHCLIGKATLHQGSLFHSSRVTPFSKSVCLAAKV